MLTKEECLRALRVLACRNETGEGIEAIYPYFKPEIDCLHALIHKHFSNPPLGFEELNKGYPIYDNDEIVCGWKFIYMIDKEYKQLLLIDEEGNVNWVNYEPNRFYRKEVQE